MWSLQKRQFFRHQSPSFYKSKKRTTEVMRQKRITPNDATQFFFPQQLKPNIPVKNTIQSVQEMEYAFFAITKNDTLTGIKHRDRMLILNCGKP